jgi:hypothetical protein
MTAKAIARHVIADPAAMMVGRTRFLGLTIGSICSSSTSESASKWSDRSWSEGRCDRVVKLGGSSSAGGNAAPSTRTGMRVTSRVRAASISRRTKSSGSSSRRFPWESAIVSHPGPISASSTSHAPTASVRMATKSSPRSIESTSLKTCSPPYRAASRSYIQPAGYAVSCRR